MLLAIDIGNTNIVIAIIDGKKIIKNWRIATSHTRTEDEFWLTLKLLSEDANVAMKDIDGVIISSVVPNLSSQFKSMAITHLNIEPIIVDHTLPLELKLAVDNPSEVGADRICNAYAALKKYKLPQIIIDLGTATTYDVVSENGEYLGGIISPGVEVSFRNLIKKTALLPKISFKFPKNIVGSNTVDNLQSGITYGTVTQIDGLVKKIIKEKKWTDVSVIATGGFAKYLENKSETIEYIDNNLILDGMRMIYEKVKED
ncbi:MAG: type III pantothenate kinase [Candidatus Marinimicrobia bacterium]|jgi:type III pantothenate kinase|nr:type III pantothenate kinase [Candidatus Neomarinimicrobiota bacterium]